ncbi:hypothetical protein BDR07DRAFT_1380577 [Suillus spraguei]|nr:hypothetical protein BDR07DRAFT_1380577 [Suillus spraguei]
MTENSACLRAESPTSSKGSIDWYDNDHPAVSVTKDVWSELCLRSAMSVRVKLAATIGVLFAFLFPASSRRLSWTYEFDLARSDDMETAASGEIPSTWVFHSNRFLSTQTPAYHQLSGSVLYAAPNLSAATATRLHYTSRVIVVDLLNPRSHGASRIQMKYYVSHASSI